ncbi:MAG: ATP-binding protein [Promethearchaeota archaeon]
MSLEKRLNFEKVISAISSRFVGKIDLDEAINSSLRDLGNLSRADRVSMFLLNKNHDFLINTHEWCNEGINSQIQNLRKVDINTIKWWINQIEKLSFIHIRDVSKLPIYATLTKNFMEFQDIKCFLGFPIYQKLKLTGFVCFSKISERIQWMGKDFAILRIFSEILENTFDRIEAENALRENQELLRAIFEAIAEGIVAIDNDGHITQINARFIYMWRVPDAVVEKMDFCLLIDNIVNQLKDPELFKEKIDNLIKTSRNVFDMLIFKDGRIFDQYSCPITRNGKIIGRLWSFRDVTEHQHAEQELKKSEHMYREAFTRANFYKDIFTHDMNNIFHNIQFSAELLSMLRNDDSKLEESDDIFNIIKNQISRGSKLIDNVRKLSKLEESEVSLQKVDLYDMIDEAILFARKSVRNKKLDIKIKKLNEKVFVNANELLLDVFENLLYNAIKYNKNSVVKIQVNISKAKTNGIFNYKVEILDNGIGILNKNKKLIFQKGYKKDTHVRGMGIGLSLVKKIINSYNGKIWVENRIKEDYTKGSNFTFLIPK